MPEVRNQTNREGHPLESSEVEAVPGFLVASGNLGMPWPANASPLSTSAVTWPSFCVSGRFPTTPDIAFRVHHRPA